MEDSNSSDVHDDWSNREFLALSSSTLIANEESENNSNPLLARSHHHHHHTTTTTTSSTSHDAEDDDNWSRQVETDELVRVPSSVLDDDPAPEGEMGGEPPGPQREEPTLKEKLVERERQRRVETERARLKRHFALRESVTEEQDGDNEAVDESVAGTIGEGSIVGPMEVLEEESMTYPMERFLQEQGTNLDDAGKAVRDPLRDAQNQGVVMERFLQEPVLVEPATEEEQGHPSSTVERSVSFDMDSPGTPPLSPVLVGLRASSMGSALEQISATPPRSGHRMDYDVDNSASIEVNTPGEGGTSVGGVTDDDDDVACIEDLVGVEETPQRPTMDDHDSSLVPPESPNTLDQPRVLGLTQAEIEELAAIEEVSQQNAPPSERDDLSTSSFVAEMVTDFGPSMDHHGTTTFSQGTPTTAMESTSIQSIRASDPTDDQHSIEEPASVDSNLMDDDGSAAGGSASVDANPPSERGDTLLSPLLDRSNAIDNLPNDSSAVGEEAALNLWTSLSSSHDEYGPDDLSDLATLNAGVVNRQIRPGMVPLRNEPSSDIVKSAVRRAQSAPAGMDIDVDGFDYDKDAPVTPTRDAFAQIAASEMWSPGSRLSVDPSPVLRGSTNIKPRPDLRTDENDGRQHQGIALGSRLAYETEPLMPSIPSEIVTVGKADANRTSLGTESRYAEEDDAKLYLESSLLEKAFPSRAMALGMTVLVEVPVLVTILGTEDSLRSSLSQSNYHLLMGLLPICSAMSGNVGLQSNTLTHRSLVLGQISKTNYISWLRQEVGTAAILGVGMGVLVGLLAFILSGFNTILSIAILLAQSTSVTAAGLTGSVMPVLLDSLLGRQAPKWSGLMVTSIQDVLSTFAMVFITVKLLTLFGVSSSDQEGACHLTKP